MTRPSIWTGILMTSLLGLVGTSDSRAEETPSVEANLPPCNLLRNAGFELGDQFNGAFMRQGSEYIRTFLALQGQCRQLPAEGWWVEGDSTDGVSLQASEAHTGARSLILAPPSEKAVSVSSSPETPVPAGAVTLSAWVQTAGVKGMLEIDFIASGAKLVEIPRFLDRKQIALPETASQWTRVQLTAEAPANAAVAAKITVQSGRVVVDDLQMEVGAAATAFDVRNDDRLVLTLDGTPEARLPCWREGDATVRTLRIRNDSVAPIRGDLEIWVGPWSKMKSEKAATVSNLELKPGGVATVPLRVDHLPLGAYVVVPVLRRDGAVLVDGERSVDLSAAIGGVNSNSMLTSRTAIRFAIGSKTDAAKMFGVGNGMLDYGWNGCDGCWSPGWPLALFAAAKENGFVCGRGRCDSEDQAYLFAVAGIPFHRMESCAPFEGAPKGAEFEVPGKVGGVDIWNPRGMEHFKNVAREVGEFNGGNSLIVTYQMCNECPFPMRDGLCPTNAADAHFRNWCRERHGDLAALNGRWGTSYTSWDEVEQPASARYADEVQNRPKPEGAAAIDWTASLGNITPEIKNRMMEVPGRGMDWHRWRTWSALWAYNTFRDTAMQYDKKTLYTTNLCFPNFWPQMSMPFFRQMNAAMLDSQYTSGLRHGLGSPMEMMEILEMTESNTPDKPLWGIEVYVQPQWPAEFAPLQNWGMVAHGMAVDLTFAWGPYSDVGIPKEPRAWEKPDATAMWMLIDLDGTKLPAYFTNQRSVEEIRAFHAKHDALSLRRVPTNVAFFVSRDTAEYISLTTANKPWESFWGRARTNLCYWLRLSGVTADFVDDETLPTEPGRFTTIIVPSSYALSQETAKKLASFAQAGGTVVLAGPSGVVDPWLNKYANLGGPAWTDLRWTAPDFQADTAAVAFVAGSSQQPSGPEVFKGVEFGAIPDAEPLRDAAGTVIGWKRPWGKGRLVAYGVFADAYHGNPHPSPNVMAWVGQIVDAAGLPYTGRWRSDTADSNAGMHGEGTPVVEVVVRVRKGNEANERFVFFLNQGGQGEGTVEIPVAAGDWKATDALTEAAVANANLSDGVWRVKIACKPWEYRVFHLTKMP